MTRTKNDETSYPVVALNRKQNDEQDRNKKAPKRQSVEGAITLHHQTSRGVKATFTATLFISLNQGLRLPDSNVASWASNFCRSGNRAWRGCGAGSRFSAFFSASIARAKSPL